MRGSLLPPRLVRLWRLDLGEDGLERIPNYVAGKPLECVQISCKSGALGLEPARLRTGGMTGALFVELVDPHTHETKQWTHG
jgi:hypothetical protein